MGLPPLAQIDTAAATMPRRPVLRYYGSGWARSPWTISHFPDHAVYCEPFLGAASILLRKPRAKLEIANDLDNRVLTFFHVLRERPDELLAAIRLTPWHEAEYTAALEPAADKLEEARRFFVLSWMSVRGGPNPGPRDFRWQKKNTRRSAAVKDIADLGHLLAAADRLRNVQFLHRDGLDVIAKMRGTGALIYADPPYLAAVRARPNGYRHEPGDEWHERLAALLWEHDGPALVAGYPSPLYRELYELREWRRVERPQATNSGGRRTEALWINPIAQAAIAAPLMLKIVDPGPAEDTADVYN